MATKLKVNPLAWAQWLEAGALGQMRNPGSYKFMHKGSRQERDWSPHFIGIQRFACKEVPNEYGASSKNQPPSFSAGRIAILEPVRKKDRSTLLLHPM
jgi:hypothetical protein